MDQQFFKFYVFVKVAQAGNRLMAVFNFHKRQYWTGLIFILIFSAAFNSNTLPTAAKPLFDQTILRKKIE